MLLGTDFIIYLLHYFAVEFKLLKLARERERERESERESQSYN